MLNIFIQAKYDICYTTSLSRNLFPGLYDPKKYSILFIKFDKIVSVKSEKYLKEWYGDCGIRRLAVFPDWQWYNSTKGTISSYMTILPPGNKFCLHHHKAFKVTINDVRLFYGSI